MYSTVEFILNLGPTSCLKYYYTGLTAVDFAFFNGHQDVVSYLRNEQHCSSGLDQAFKGAMSRLSSYRPGLSDCLDSTGINPINIDNGACFSQLQVACLKGNLAAVKMCVSKSGCNSSVGFPGCLTPLNNACIMGHLTIAKYLVTEYECDPNCASCDYDIVFTPLLMATIGGQFEVVRWLVSEQKCKPVFTYIEDQCEHNFPLLYHCLSKW